MTAFIVERDSRASPRPKARQTGHAWLQYLRAGISRLRSPGENILGREGEGRTC